MCEDTVEMLYEAICAKWSALGQPEKRSFLDALMVPVTYNSTRIENDRIDIHDTRAVLGDGSVVNYTGELRDLYEIDNHGSTGMQRAGCGIAKGVLKG